MTDTEFYKRKLIQLKRKEKRLQVTYAYYVSKLVEKRVINATYQRKKRKYNIRGIKWFLKQK